MPENLQKKDGLQEGDGDLNYQAIAQRLLDEFLNDCSTNDIDKRAVNNKEQNNEDIIKS